MDKIEKLMHIKTDKNQHVSPDTVFEMCCKINEITDILNSRLFEPIITVHNQSQKQPEGEEYEQPIKVRKYPKLEGSEKPCSENKIEDIYVYRKPEKREKWREELERIIDDIDIRETPSGGNWLDTEYKSAIVNVLAEFISRLLSERTKEVVMDIRSKYWSEDKEDFDTYIEDKLHKLLKEKKMKKTEQKGRHLEGYKSVFYGHEVADNLQAQWEAGRNGINDVDKLFELAYELYKQGCKDLEGAYIKDLNTKPDKQKDWRDRIQSFSLGVSESFKIDGEYIDSKEELVAFISQLLSERTFTKDELEIIDDWAEWDYCTNKDVVRVKDKVSKLLKEEK